MKKSWNILYLIYSTIVFVISSLVCSIGFYSNTVSMTIDKYNFESIYLNTEIDFIIPSPSYDQVETLENDENGILKVTPYYSFTTSILLNNKNKDSNVVLFDSIDKISFTPYCEKRLIDGSIPNTSLKAIVDEKFSKNNNAYVGDNISLKVNQKKYDFTISAISETNTFYDGSVALIIDKVSSKEMNNNLKYSAAYVKSNDYLKCKHYLENDYKPLGRLKDRSSFNSDEAYNLHVNNFNSADWSKEVTNMKQNYDSLSLKYKNVYSNSMSNIIIGCTILLLSIIGFNIILLVLPSQKRKNNEFLTKKKGTVKDIIKFNLKGNLFDALLCFIVLVISSLVIILINDAIHLFGLILYYTLLPFITLLIGFIINILASNKIIKTIYKRK